MDDLDRARYISLTTFKRDGSPVSSPVWITGVGGAYVFTTGDSAWKTRRLLRVDISDPLATDRVINELMGKDASARFRFIMERAEEADELDV